MSKSIKRQQDKCLYVYPEPLVFIKYLLYEMDVHECILLVGNVEMTSILQMKKTDSQRSVSSSKRNVNHRSHSILKQQPRAQCEKPP